MCLKGTIFLTALDLASSVSLKVEHSRSFTVLKGGFYRTPCLCVSASISSVPGSYVEG